MSTYAAIHVGCKQLGIVEEDRRDLYRRVTGKDSLTQMTPAEHESVVAELRRLGFAPKAASAKGKKLTGKYAPKLQALWIAGWNLGLIRDNTDQALLAFVKRQTGLDHTGFLHHADDASKATEALKGWLEREARVDWSRELKILPGHRIAFAQFIILSGPDAPRSLTSAQFVFECCKLSGKKGLDCLTARDWITVMNALGRQIRGGGHE